MFSQHSVIMKNGRIPVNRPYLLHSKLKRLAGGKVACCRNYEKWNTAHCDYWIYNQPRKPTIHRWETSCIYSERMCVLVCLGLKIKVRKRVKVRIGSIWRLTQIFFFLLSFLDGRLLTGFWKCVVEVKLIFWHRCFFRRYKIAFQLF